MSKSITISGLALLCLIQTYAQKTVQGLSANKNGIAHTHVKQLRSDIEANKLKEITSVVVLRNGEIAIEEYFNGSDRETLHDTRSLTKSFTSTMMGIAIQEGYIQSIDQTLGDFYSLRNFKNYSERKSNVTLKSLLTMTSGFDGFDFDASTPGNEEKMYPTNDWVKFALDLSMKKFEAGDLEWQYFTAGVVLLGDILNSKVPNGLEVYTSKKLFEPLGIEKVTWQYTPTGVPNTAGSCQLTSLAFAKYGQLYKNKGVWEGKQIVTKEWINRSLQKHSVLPFDGLSYGYLFWSKDFQFGEDTHEVYAASGNGGNKVFIFTELDIVVVITSTAYNQPYAHRQADKIVEDYILPALTIEDIKESN